MPFIQTHKTRNTTEHRPTKDHGKALGITAFRGLIILGIGHLYVGRFYGGIALIMASTVLFAAGFAGGFVLVPGNTVIVTPVVLGLMSGAVLYILQLYDVHHIIRRPSGESSGAGG